MDKSEGTSNSSISEFEDVLSIEELYKLTAVNEFASAANTVEMLASLLKFPGLFDKIAEKNLINRLDLEMKHHIIRLKKDYDNIKMEDNLKRLNQSLLEIFCTQRALKAKSKKTPVYVTQPYLPPLEEFIPYLEQIWENKWLTNAGPFHQQLESALADYLGVEHLALFTNGTIALVTALQALRITGEVITTPYSFVATSHSLLWNNIKPVFADIDPETLNLDPNRIEEAITPQTTAILPVHVYGYPCDVERIQKIADTYGLKVVYDAAHAFGVKYEGESLLKHGDLSVLSFHATKVFTTFEGGAIVCNDAKIKQRIDYLKNFGFAGEVTVVAPGINGKMNEFQAALGLLQLKYYDQAIERRKAIDSLYREGLKDVPGIRLQSIPSDGQQNYSYFPILVEADYPRSRDGLYQKLRDQGIYTRRYFYPLISDFPMYRGLPSAMAANLPIAKSVAERVLCLPIHPMLTEETIDAVIRQIMSF